MSGKQREKRRVCVCGAGWLRGVVCMSECNGMCMFVRMGKAGVCSSKWCVLRLC